MSSPNQNPEAETPSRGPSIEHRWREDRHSPPPIPRRRPTAEVAVISILLVWNLAANLAVPEAASLPLSVAAVALLLLVARRNRIGPELMGLRSDRLRRGARVGLAAAAAVSTIVLVLVLAPASREYLADERFVGVGWGEMIYQTMLRIPLATALAEEIAFRGVVLAMFLLWMSPWRALLASSALFGLWHILPAIEALETSPAADVASGSLATVVEVSSQVLVTAVAGAGLVWLRFRGESLAAPVLAHWAINGTAYLAGWLVVENSWA